MLWITFILAGHKLWNSALGGNCQRYIFIVPFFSAVSFNPFNFFFFFFFLHFFYFLMIWTQPWRSLAELLFYFILVSNCKFSPSVFISSCWGHWPSPCLLVKPAARGVLFFFFSLWTSQGNLERSRRFAVDGTTTWIGVGWRCGIVVWRGEALPPPLPNESVAEGRWEGGYL